MNPHIPAALLLLLAACRTEHHTKAIESAPLETQRVTIAPALDLSQSVGDEVLGTVRARSVASIAPSVMGTVRALHVKLGSQVRAGQVLVELSAKEIDAKLDQATAMFAQADLELKRAEQLKGSQSIPQARYESATAQFRVAEAALVEAKVMRGYTTLRAPFAGIITAKQCEAGDLALPGKPLLVLESRGTLRLEASVPENIASLLHTGDVLSVRLDALPEPVPATLSELSPSADPVSRTVLVKLDLPSLPGLRSGMFGRLTVHTGDERAVLVPSSALVRRGQMELVFVVQDQKARLRIVRAGRESDGNTRVLSGLRGGELVVASQANVLVDGQPLEVKP